VRVAAPAIPCPIAGCNHVFHRSRGGWDAHVGSPRVHPSWLPSRRSPEARKAAFKKAFPEFFGRSVQDGSSRAGASTASPLSR
jgi:hypothetical protein